MIRSAFGYGRGRSRTALTILKIAVLAPIPSASVRTATKVNPGDLRSWRRANFRSFMLFSAQCFDGINTRSAPCRQPAGDQCHHGEREKCKTQSWDIEAAHTVKQTLQSAPGADDGK